MRYRIFLKEMISGLQCSETPITDRRTRKPCPNMENFQSEPRRSCETIGNPQWCSFPFSRGRPPRLALVIRPVPSTMSRNFHEYARLVMRAFPLPATTGTPASYPRQKPPSLFPMTVRFLELRILHESACPVVSVHGSCVRVGLVHWLWAAVFLRHQTSKTRERRSLLLLPPNTATK